MKKSPFGDKGIKYVVNNFHEPFLSAVLFHSKSNIPRFKDCLDILKIIFSN